MKSIIDFLFITFCHVRSIEEVDFEEPEDWQMFITSTKEDIHDLLTLPVRNAWERCEHKGWQWKQYIHLVKVVTNTDISSVK